ncbi:MAG: plastocyanin/azurin family copper-binding protein [Vicinamibacterales bacterium]
MTFARTSSLFVLLAAVVTGAVLLSAVVFSAMGHGDWGMGWGMGDHMGHMMGGGTNTSNSTVTVGSASESVQIRDFAFTPGNLQVPVGAKVSWTNYDDAPHSAKAKNGMWDTGILSKGESKTVTFDTVGDYTYYCTVHPSMAARLQVR